MARLRPSLEQLDQLIEPLNDGELHVAHALACLDDEWTVYVKPRLGQDAPDFVALHDRHGVCAIEVKNWYPGLCRSNDDGVLEYCDDDGGWVQSADQPQIESNRLRETIFDLYYARPDDGFDVTPAVRTVIVLPQFTHLAARELFARTSMSAPELAISVWGGDGLDRWIETTVRGLGCPPPRADSMARLRLHLVASEIVPSDEPPAILSAGVREIESNPSDAAVRRVRGPAGSGKSFGVTARAARLASVGRTSLVLTFNSTLSDHLRALVNDRCREFGANPTLVTCSNFHSFCSRVVEDAERTGIRTTLPDGFRWPEAILSRTYEAFEAGFQRRYDAVLVDEGQDFTADWWDVLRRHVVRPDGEMLLVVDPTQDVYDKESWTDEAEMAAAGFAGPWIELTSAYRMPSDIVPLTNDFAYAHVGGGRLLAEVPNDTERLPGSQATSKRTWRNIDRVSDLGREIGREVVQLLSDNPDLTPKDVVFLCDYHHDGVAAVAEIEAAGVPVHHIFSRDPAQRAVRKRRFAADADAVKGCTVHAFKGWEAPVVVMGVGCDEKSKRLAYVAMTRLSADASRLGGRSIISVVNSDRNIADFQIPFEAEVPRPAVRWSAPNPAARVG